MPTKIAASNTHQSQRLAYHPGGCPVSSMERSQRLASGTLRDTSKGASSKTMQAKRLKAIAAGLTAAIQRMPQIAIQATDRPKVRRRVLSAVINTNEIKP